jgi:thioredoxin reductase
VTGVYIVGELSGMGLIKTAINEGMLAVDNIKRQLEASGEWNAPAFDPHDGRVAQSNGDSAGRPLDVIIVGAGPAGLSASLAAHQHGLNYLTLEQGEIASTIRNYPRHKFLMAEPIEMPMYGNLYIGDGTKEALLKVWESIVANTGVRIQTQERVESICRDGNVLKVETTKGVYDTRNVVLALGKRGTPRTLGVPGEGLGKVAFKLIEADSYNDEDLLVVGGGDSAIEAALALSKGGKNRVVLAYRGKRFDRARDRNRKSLEEAEEQGKIKVFRESNISEILPASVKLKTPAGETEVPNQYAFILIGGESPEAFLRKMGIEIVEKVLTA